MKPGSKTPIRKPTLKALSALNDQLCYFQFVKEEFRRTRDRFGPGAQDLYTTDAFADNEFAKRIHVKLGKLLQFEEQTRGMGFGAFVSASYEVASTYYGNASTLLKDVLGKKYVAGKAKDPEEAFEAMLAKSGFPSLGRVPVDTLKYMRLRRNHFIHLATDPSSKFVKLSESRGAALNAEWKGTGLDFAVPRTGGFSETEAVETLKVLRVCIERMDKHVGGNLDPATAAGQLAERLDSPKRLNRDVRRQLAKKLVGAAKQTYGLGLTVGEAQKLVKQRIG